MTFLLVGDFIGVQMLPDGQLCVFQRVALWELHRQSPAMGLNITWLTAHEASVVDDTLHMRNIKVLARLADLYGVGKPQPRPLI